MIDGDVATSVDDDVNDRPSDVAASASSRDHDDDVIVADDDDCELLYACDDCDDDDDAAAFVAGYRECGREALRYLRQHGDPATASAVCDQLERHLAAVERTCHPGAPRRAPAAAGEGPRDDSALGDSLLADDERAAAADDAGAAAVTASELSENAEQLMRLAQDNPRINNILNQDSDSVKCPFCVKI